MMIDDDYKLIKENIIKDGHSYVDYYLMWTYHDKLYKVRIKPVFDNSKTDWRFLKYLAIQSERLEKYK